MRLNKLALALSLAVFALPLSAMAQEAAQTTDPAQQTDAAAEAPAAADEEEATSNLTWNLSVTSDYVFRGISQTDRKPALQGGLDYAFGDTGIYVGAWGSNVDFADPDGDGPDIELDTYIGYSVDVSDDWNLDFSVVHYSYFGERDAYGSSDYNEFFAKTTWNEMLTFTVAYANDYSNLDYSSLYVNLAGTWELGNDFSLNASIGHSDFSDDNGSYNDWNIGVSRQFGPVNAAINYYDTDISGGNVSDTIVLTLALGS
jgi:uncharacterized protein (TIGR02001 family)